MCDKELKVEAADGQTKGHRRGNIGLCKMALNYNNMTKPSIQLLENETTVDLFYLN